MATAQLTRRKAQLDLLAEVCTRHQAARVVWTDGTGKPQVTTRFQALAPDEVLLRWPRDGTNQIPGHGAKVDVFFEHEGARLVFRATTLGRLWWSCDAEGGVAVWRLALPLRIDPGQQRRHPRMRLNGFGPVRATFTNIADSTRNFAATLDNVSGGGLAATARPEDAAGLRRGDVFWVTFTLPEEPEGFEFVVRLVHTREATRDRIVVLGCTFCPGEDPTAHHERLGRIERFVATHHHAQLRHPEPESEGT